MSLSTWSHLLFPICCAAFGIEWRKLLDRWMPVWLFAPQTWSPWCALLPAPASRLVRARIESHGTGYVWSIVFVLSSQTWYGNKDIRSHGSRMIRRPVNRFASRGTQGLLLICNEYFFLKKNSWALGRNKLKDESKAFPQPFFLTYLFLLFFLSILLLLMRKLDSVLSRK